MRVGEGAITVQPGAFHLDPSPTVSGVLTFPAGVFDASGTSSKRTEEVMRKMFRKLMQDESGASLIEYVLLAALIGVAALAGMRLVGTNAQNTLQKTAGDMAR
jgi:pilus assembly protein Flp/PilA